MQDFRKLKVWQKSHELTLETYRMTVNFPQCELYGLTSQIRRASSSISANIAEGCCRGSDLEFARFLHISMGSASELDYHLLLARDLSYLPDPQYSKMVSEITEVKQMLASLIKSIKLSLKR